MKEFDEELSRLHDEEEDKKHLEIRILKEKNLRIEYYDNQVRY